jgi:hypothetical protein
MLWRWLDLHSFQLVPNILFFLWLSDNQRRKGRKGDSCDEMSCFIHFTWCKNTVNIVWFPLHQFVFYDY